MDRRQVSNCLDLDDDKVFDEEIDAISIAERHAFVDRGEESLTLEPNSSILQFDRHRELIRRLQQPDTQFPVNVDGRTNDDFRAFIFIHLCVLSFPFAPLR